MSKTVIDAIEWTSGIVVPAWVLRTSSVIEMQVAAAFLLVTTAYLGYREGRDAHPDRPAWKDRGPGFVRVMMKWESEYHEEMQAREQSEVVSFSEWLHGRSKR